MTLITVPLPTIKGREHWLDKAVTAYKAYADVEIILVRDPPSCGVAWQYGAERATGEFIHFGADDVEMHPGWWQAAAAKINDGHIPAPRVLNTDGSLQSCGDWGVEMDDGAIPEFSRGPVVSRAQWDLIGPMIPLHYFTDNWVTHRGRVHGIETVVARGYEYTHHMASEGRNEGRMARDAHLFNLYCAGSLTP